MLFSNADLLAIKAELTNDPLSLGYPSLDPANDEANANALNLVRETINVKKRSLPTSKVFNAISPLEFQALSPQQQAWVDSMLRLGQIDPFTDTGTMGGLDDCFSAESDSRGAIATAASEKGNRINQLFQAGTLSQNLFATPSDVANARNAT